MGASKVCALPVPRNILGVAQSQVETGKLIGEKHQADVAEGAQGPQRLSFRKERPRSFRVLPPRRLKDAKAPPLLGRSGGLQPTSNGLQPSSLIGMASNLLAMASTQTREHQRSSLLPFVCSTCGHRVMDRVEHHGKVFLSECWAYHITWAQWMMMMD